MPIYTHSVIAYGSNMATTTEGMKGYTCKKQAELSIWAWEIKHMV
jgi:hypothetical protein